MILAAAPAAADVTFNKDVLPILQNRCQVCHRPGEIGPMPLLTYEQTRPWARAIRTAVANRVMPPWFADPRSGHFANDTRLTDAEIATMTSWADNGAPEGDAKDKPLPPSFREGWNIRPDLVFQLPKPMRIPARGTVEYTYVVVAAPFEKDTWIAAGEIRPTNRARVHHVIAMVRPKGSKWMSQAKLGGEPWAPGPNRQADMVREATATVKFGQPVDLVYMQPHMHLRGKDATIAATYPDGRHETLLRVPRYDFNWQTVYYQKKPLRLPKGTELKLTGHWDNSAANKWNPDPAAAVRWGDQSWQEMLSAPMGVIVDRDIDPRTVIERGGFPGRPGVQ